MPVIVAIRRCPRSCRWRTAAIAPPSLSDITTSTDVALEVHVDADAGDLRARQAAHLGVLGVEPDQRAAVDVVVAGALEVGVRAVPVARPLGREQQQVEALGPDALLEPAEHLMEERMLKVRMTLARLHEHADDVAALGDEAAGGRGGRVVELAGEAHDALARLGTHVGIAVQRARDGADRHAADPGQLLDCDSLVHVPKTVLETVGGSMHGVWQNVKREPRRRPATGASGGEDQVTGGP